MMGSSPTFLDAVIGALDQKVAVAKDNESMPVAILWPDKGRQWESVVRRLAAQRPVLTLGTYDPAAWTGPAIWIRCVIDGSLSGPAVAGTPIVYLPGYERSDVRLPEEAPAELRPLLELQYRGQIFAQLSNRDWTLAAFLQAAPPRGGLGIEVGTDDATKAAMRAAVDVYADWQVDNLRNKAPLKAEFFNGLLVPDVDRTMLEWLDDRAASEASRSAEKQRAFRETCKDRYGVDPVEVGEIGVALSLGQRPTDAWVTAWRLYADAPDRYPRVEGHLRSAKPDEIRDKKSRGSYGLFDARDAWPQVNEAEEELLRIALRGLADVDAETARDKLVGLEQEHRERRRWVWARLGRSPLASAVEHLADLAKATRKHVPSGSVGDIVAAYTEHAWLADDAAMRALACVETPAHVEAVSIAINGVYRGWLEVGATRLQHAIGPTAADYVVTPLDEWPDGTVVIFTDGLRYDVGRRLGEELRVAGLAVEVKARLTALPTITPTGKPASSPAMRRLVGGAGLGPSAPGSAAVITADGLRKEIAASGYQVLGLGDTGSPGGKGWAEQGDIDKLGHDETRLAPLLDAEIHKLERRIAELLDAGWTQVVVVTDHGWLHLPGGLPKAELALHLAEAAMRKGRAARLVDGAVVDVPVVPWTWDPAVRIAIAPGISCFVGSPIYEHGGVSPQECITPLVIARAGESAAGSVEFEQASWAGLRVRVVTSGVPAGAVLDLRRKAGDPASSLLDTPRGLDDAGAATMLVEDADLIGSAAFIVVTTASGVTLASRRITIGEND